MTYLEKYLHNIRNAEKKHYAEHYAAWRLSGDGTGEPLPQRPLSYMAAQAARLNIDELIRVGLHHQEARRE